MVQLLIDSSTVSGNMKNIREKNFGFEGGSEDMELITFDLATVSRATDNFSNNNKLGQGGFGPVYKVLKKKVKCDYNVVLPSTNV